MFKLTTEELAQQGAVITTREIQQQPELWQQVWSSYEEKYQEITAFLDKIKASTPERIRVVFTGAGTSQYVGDTIVPYLNAKGDHQRFIFQSIGTTEIVSAPQDYLFADEPTLLVSFARSGNSPESTAAVEITNQYVKHVYHLTVTCAPDGALAKAAKHDPAQLLLLMPEKSNDAGFAMTGSFTCMTLMSLLVFDQTAFEEKKAYVSTLCEMGAAVIEREAEIANFLSGDFHRIAYLGSGPFSGLAREAQLKVLELTAGKIATIFDSSMGFRHGPKSFVDERTLIFGFVSNDAYTQQYDWDILNELTGDGTAQQIVAIGQLDSQDYSGATFQHDAKWPPLPDGYLALADIMVAQTVALLTSVKVGNTPDTPSPSGTVNRVVKGVTIHQFKR